LFAAAKRIEAAPAAVALLLLHQYLTAVGGLGL